VQAIGHVVLTNAFASADLIERQLGAAESNFMAGRAAFIKARDDKGRVKLPRRSLPAQRQNATH
jgi:hypothetical protein